MSINNDQASASYQSTDSSTNPALIYSFPQKSSGLFTAQVLAFDGSQNTAAWQVQFSGKRLSGNCILVGTPVVTSIGEDISLALSAVTVSVFGSSFVINVAGISSTTINWDISMKIMYDNSNS